MGNKGKQRSIRGKKDNKRKQVEIVVNKRVPTINKVIKGQQGSTIVSIG